MRRIALLAALVAALVLSAGAASAAPAQPVTTTEHHATEVIHAEIFDLAKVAFDRLNCH